MLMTAGAILHLAYTDELFQLIAFKFSIIRSFAAPNLPSDFWAQVYKQAFPLTALKMDIG